MCIFSIWDAAPCKERRNLQLPETVRCDILLWGDLHMKKNTVIRRILISLLILAMLPSGEAFAANKPEAFILGVDVSELLSQESSGVVYYDEGGNPADALAVLAESGVSHVRLRVWNDPFDEQGRGYGAGNINAERAAILSARAAKLGMKSLIDFHYSDFWADPSRQIAPKAWAGMSVDEKETALAAYTKEALALILDAGGDVDMVQVGNETTTGMAGEYEAGDMARLIAAGCQAVRETAAERGLEITVCVHLTDPQNYGMISAILRGLDIRKADYDAVGLSYYPYWHGTLEDLSDTVGTIRKDFRKEVFVAETAWPFTLDDGDGAGNVIGSDPGIYPVTPGGQALAWEDVCCTVADAGGFGVFYWGGIWTPVSPDPEKNRSIWETEGSGWATRFASAYDPEHVGNDYGGCAWDNQAMFDFTGHPLPVLKTLRMLSESGRLPVPQPLAEATAEPSAEAPNMVLNPDFEDPDYSMWETSSDTADVPYDYQDNINDAHSGTVAFHFWSEKDMSFRIQQTVNDLPLGKYEASVWSQGGDMTDASMVLYVIADGQYYETSFMNSGWADWQHPVISNIPVASGSLTIGVKIKCGKKSWGTLDDFSVIKK